MRILIVDLGAVWGGQEIYSRTLAQQLSKRGWSVTCLSPHKKHETTGLLFKRIDFRYSAFLRLIPFIYQISKTHDIVHFNGIRAIYLSALIFSHVPFVGTKHSPYVTLERPTLKSRLAHIASAFIFHRLKWLISISKQTLVELPSCVQSYSSVILNGVPDIGPPDFSRTNRSVLKVCFVGRLIAEKGIMRLLEAVNIAHCRGISVHLLLAGEGPLEYDAKRYVIEHGLFEVVVFLGYVDSPGDVFRASNLCCLPSLHEGLPLSLLEAMSAGCALLGHDIPGVRDVIRHGVNGVLTEITPDAIAVAFMELASDRVYLDDLRKNARQDYEQKWQLDRMVDETEAVYRRVINA